MSVIFFHRLTDKRRHFLWSTHTSRTSSSWRSARASLLVSVISGRAVAGRRPRHGPPLPVTSWALAGTLPRAILWFLGVAGLALLLTALYMVMPVGRLSFRHALAGDVTATVLWELVRRVLAWYFSTLSMVNVVYGSLASTIGVLLTLEAAALVLLVEAQVIARATENCSEAAAWARLNQASISTQRFRHASTLSIWPVMSSVGRSGGRPGPLDAGHAGPRSPCDEHRRLECGAVHRPGRRGATFSAIRSN